MAALEFHDPVSGRWCAAQPAASHQITSIVPRSGTKHLAVKLPDGREVARQHVAHENHEHVINVTAGGRCKLCGVNPDTEPDTIGRVYRGGDAAGADEAEPAGAPPEPQTLDDAKRIAPRTTRA